EDVSKSPHAGAVFACCASADLVVKDSTGGETVVSENAIHYSFSPSPDGSMILRKVIHRPFSYLVPYYRFPQKVTVITADGKPVGDIADLPLADNIPNGFNAVQTGPRSHN